MLLLIIINNNIYRIRFAIMQIEKLNSKKKHTLYIIIIIVSIRLLNDDSTITLIVFCNNDTGYPSKKVVADRAHYWSAEGAADPINMTLESETQTLLLLLLLWKNKQNN